jgi:hypothetical protein
MTGTHSLKYLKCAYYHLQSCKTSDGIKTYNIKQGKRENVYEQMPGLKINFEKNKVIVIGGDNEVDVTYAEFFYCQIGKFPIKYLGVPIAASRLHIIGWMRLEEKFEKKLDV